MKAGTNNKVIYKYSLWARFGLWTTVYKGRKYHICKILPNDVPHMYKYTHTPILKKKKQVNMHQFISSSGEMRI